MSQSAEKEQTGTVAQSAHHDVITQLRAEMAAAQDEANQKELAAKEEELAQLRAQLGLPMEGTSGNSVLVFF